MIAFDLMLELAGAGIHLEAGANGKLLAKAAAGVITAAHRAQIADSKPALLAAVDLNRRIRTMAKRWSYSADELTDVLQLARANPEAELRWVDIDERKFGAGEHLEGWPPAGAW